MFQEASSIRSNQKPGTVSHHLIGSNGFKSAIKRDFHSSLQLRQQLRCDKKKNRFLCEAENRNDVINVIVSRQPNLLIKNVSYKRQLSIVSLSHL